MWTYYNTSKIDLNPVKSFNLNKFLGLWYEIARYDSDNEHNMTNVSTEYILLDDGSLKVVNTCRMDGAVHRIIGHAKATDPKEPGAFKVTFFMNFYNPYRILSVDREYNAALIGGRDEKSLWLLSRTPRMSDDALQNLLSEADTRGFDISKLIYVKQG